MDNIKYNAAPVSIIAKPDPVSLDQQAKYKQQGLTVTSNNTSIIPRNDAGSIILQENSQTNPLLIIEPVSTKITTDSILRVIDTQFQYYSFPVSIRTTPTNASFDLPDISLDLILDPVYARYKPSANYKIAANDITNPGLGNYGTISGILMDTVVDGQSQTKVNSYYITKEIKESGVDLQFQVKLNHRFDTNLAGAKSPVRFSVIKQGPDTELTLEFKGPYDTENMGRYEVLNTEISVIITNEEFNIGDYFSIGAATDVNTPDSYHTINSEQTYWVITNAAKDVDEWNREI
jgi:hypothetical protein